MSRQQLTDLTRGLQHAAQTTLSVVAEQYIVMLEQFFEPTEDGTLTAKMIRVAIDDDTYVNVPLVSLVTPMGLTLDNMKVDMSVRLEAVKQKRTPSSNSAITGASKGQEVNRSSMTVAVAPRGNGSKGKSSDHLQISMEFKSREPPESLMRILDLYANNVSPVNHDGGALPPTRYAQSSRYKELMRKSQD